MAQDRVRHTYMEGYAAFEQGDLERAAMLADVCLASSNPASYWYAGALGLKCWIANWADDRDALEQAAERLLALDTGTDKPWFDGLALLNLALARRRAGRTEESTALFLRAAERYAAQHLQLGQPGEWQHILDCHPVPVVRQRGNSPLGSPARPGPGGSSRAKRPVGTTCRGGAGHAALYRGPKGRAGGGRPGRPGSQSDFSRPPSVAFWTDATSVGDSGRRGRNQRGCPTVSGGSADHSPGA